MNCLGSVKERLRTWFYINQNRKKKLALQKNTPKKIEVVHIFIESKEKVLLDETTVKKEKEKNNFSKESIKKYRECFSENTIQNKLGSSKISSILKRNNLNMEKKKQIVLEDDKSLLKNSILEHVKECTLNIQKEIKDLKKEITHLEVEQKNIKTEKEIKIHQQKLEQLQERIILLRRKMDMIKENYELKGLEELGDSLLYHYIDTFKFKYPISDIDILTESCKVQLYVLENIVNLEEKVESLTKKEDEKKRTIEQLENDYSLKQTEYEKLKYQEEVFTHFLEKENEYLKKLEKETQDNTISYHSKYRLKLNEEYLKNLTRLYAGIYVFPTSFLGAFVGAYLIQNSLTPLLKKAFYYKEFRRYYYVYTEYIKKQDENIDLIESTFFLLQNSLTTLKIIKQDFQKKYKGFLEIDKYKSYYNNLNKLIKTLEKQEEQLKKQKESILKNKEKNKQKALKLKDYYSK